MGWEWDMSLLINVKKECCITRNIGICDFKTVPDSEKLKAHLMKIDGVLNVSVSASNKAVSVRYDVNKLDYSIVVEDIKSMGVLHSFSFLARLKQQWLTYIDSNIRENANLSSTSCCNKAPYLKK